MENKFEFKTDGFEHHQCSSKREGKWIIFQCTQCNYKRKLDTETSKPEVISPGDVNALHTGMHTPVGVQLDKYHPN